nr:hypothetical protein CFP56_10902 [Quercus suber]
MLDKELRDGNISGAKPSIRGLAITHVMYADDIVLFSKATRNDAKRLADCLEKYCTWSGQSINRGKFGIFFSKHTGPNSRRAIRQQFNMKRLKKDAVYLGAPLFLSRSPSKDFKYLQDKLEAKLADYIKINVDAALNSSKTTLAVVARNHLREVLFIWGKENQLCSPLQAEAMALL